MGNAEAEEKLVEAPKLSVKPIEAQKKEPEMAIEGKKFLKPVTGKYTDEIIEEVAKISIDELDQPGGWKKLLIAMYKEKAYENRTLQDKVNALNITNSDLGKKLGVAKERLRHTTGVGVAFGILYIIAGAMLAYLASLPDSLIRTILFWLAIGIFVVCTGYHLWNSKKQKDVE